MNTLNDLQQHFRPASFKSKQMMKKILLIEDDFSTREIVKEALFGIQEFNIDVSSAHNGLEGLSFLAIHKDTDLVILDLMMPFMNGEDFLSGLLRTNENVYNQSEFLITSGSEPGKKIAEDYNASFIAKPFSIEKLMAQVRSLLAPKKKHYAFD